MIGFLQITNASITNEKKLYGRFWIRRFLSPGYYSIGGCPRIGVRVRTGPTSSGACWRAPYAVPDGMRRGHAGGSPRRPRGRAPEAIAGSNSVSSVSHVPSYKHSSCLLRTKHLDTWRMEREREQATTILRSRVGDSVRTTHICDITQFWQPLQRYVD